MDVKLQVIHAGEWKVLDYSSYVGNVVISDNINALGAHLKFSMGESMYTLGVTPGEIPVGSKIVLSEGETILFRGIIVTKNVDMPGKLDYEAYDYGFYLNKSMISIQFNNVSASTAIERVCSKQGVKIHKICDIPTKIRKIYHANLVIDVIRDILGQAEMDLGTKYRIEMHEGDSLVIEKYDNLVVELTGDYFRNSAGFTFDPAAAAIESRYTESMENLKTSVTVVSGSEKHLVRRREVKAKIPIDVTNGTGGSNYEDLYGRLNEVIRADGKNNSQINNIAQKRIKEVGRFTRSLRVKLFGDSRVRSARILNLNPDGKIKGALTGTFLVKSCSHNYNNNESHTMDLELEYYTKEESENA